MSDAQTFNAEAAFRELCREVLAPCTHRRGIPERHEPFDIEVSVEAGVIRELRIAWPEFDWSATCDVRGLRIRTGVDEQLLAWTEAPRSPDGPRASDGSIGPGGGIHAALYGDYRVVMNFPLAPNGSWSMLRCPPIFGLRLWNVVLWGWNPLARGMDGRSAGTGDVERRPLA